MSRLLPLMTLPFWLLPMGCEHYSPVPVDRQPDASLLLPCERPVPPPEKPSNKDVGLGWLDAVQKYLACEAKHQALVNFVKGGK